MNHYYFYIDDQDFGPLFLKVYSYAPWGIKLCINGHEWAKRQLDKRGIAYEALDNGFISCAEPEKLQRICDSLGPEQIEWLFRKWLKRIPLPLRPEDRQAGYDWDLSIWQMEVSLTQIFDRPLRGREFFEEVICDSFPSPAANPSFRTLAGLKRHVGLWPGGCPEPALRATDISWLPNVEKYRSQPSRIATPAHRCRSHCGHPGRSVRPDVISLARGRALRKGRRFGVIRDPLELMTPRPRVSSQSFKPGQD